MSKRKVYWDSSCFICFLNKGKDEDARRGICEDILRHAERGDVEIHTSTVTIAEVVRPKDKHTPQALPAWAEAIAQKLPIARGELETLWDFYVRRTRPSRKLTKEQIAKIQGMFEWDFIKKVNADENITSKAVALSRDYGLKPMDAIHAASAIAKKVDELQRWDKDYDKVKHLVNVTEPSRLSDQNSLFTTPSIGPTPEDFEGEEGEAREEHSPAHPAEVRGRDSGSLANETAKEESKEVSEPQKVVPPIEQAMSEAAEKIRENLRNAAEKAKPTPKSGLAEGGS